jgi:hypothetical protein
MSGNQESELAAALVTREWAADSVATTPRTARGVGHPLFGFINKKQEEGSSYFGKDGPPVLATTRLKGVTHRYCQWALCRVVSEGRRRRGQARR